MAEVWCVGVCFVVRCGGSESGLGGAVQCSSVRCGGVCLCVCSCGVE